MYGKRILISVLLCLWCFINPLLIQASTSSQKISFSNTEVNEKETYTVSFNAPIANKAVQNDLNLFNECIIEMFFNYDICGETVTIGYNGIMENLDTIIKYVTEELYTVYQTYQTDERLPTPTTNINIEQLLLNHINVVVDNSFDVLEIKSAEHVIMDSTSYSNPCSVGPLPYTTYHYIEPNFAVVENPAIMHMNQNQTSSLCYLLNNRVLDEYIEPHNGDGHERFAEGYQWQPDIIQVGFNNNYSSQKNRVKLYYEYLPDSNHLNYLQETGNEGLEISIVFYNTPQDDIISNIGLPYVERYGMNDNIVWSTNQPTAYLDSDFNLISGGSSISYCIGVEDASQLVSGTTYYWYITGVAGENLGDNRYANDGRFLINCNRTYESTSIFSIVGSFVDGALNQVTWKRFQEEHEGTILPRLSIDKKWYNGYGSTPNYSAWYLGETGQEWEYIANIHTERLAGN